MEEHAKASQAAQTGITSKPTSGHISSVVASTSSHTRPESAPEKSGETDTTNIKPSTTKTMTSQPAEFIPSVVQEEDLRDCAEISFNINQTTAPDTSPGDDSQDNIAVPPKRRKSKRLIPGIPNYSRTATPKQVLEAADSMPDEEARSYLLRHFHYHGWGNVGIQEIASDPYMELSIDRYRYMARDLREFDFSLMEEMVTATYHIRKHAWEGNMLAACEVLRMLAYRWKQRSDQQKVFSFAGQILWGVGVTQAEAAKAQASAN